MNFWIEQFITILPIKVCVFTGGEPFLFLNEVNESIKFATQYDLVSRVVTNGFWAVNIKSARRKLGLIVKSGLKELNLSTGSNHMEWVPISSIFNALQVALEQELTIVVNIEHSIKTDNFLIEFIKLFTSRFSEEERARIKLITTEALYFDANYETDDLANNSFNVDNNIPCKSLLTNVSITPDNKINFCCGLAVNRTNWFSESIDKTTNIKYLLNKASSNPFYSYLTNFGPRYLYMNYSKRNNLETKNNSIYHPCFHCYHLFLTNKIFADNVLSNKEYAEIALIEAINDL
jgi:hypothetical protein